MGGETRFAWRGSSKLPYGGPVPQGQTTFALCHARRCAHLGSGACSPHRIEHRPPGVLRGSPHMMSTDLPVPAWSDLLPRFTKLGDKIYCFEHLSGFIRLPSLVMPSYRTVAVIPGVSANSSRPKAPHWPRSCPGSARPQFTVTGDHAPPPLRPASLRSHLAAELRDATRRGSSLGSAQRRNADARLGQVYDRARTRMDQPLRFHC
jgi:hypothetical protein